jgi:arginyl-tRNA synthetase
MNHLLPMFEKEQKTINEKIAEIRQKYHWPDTQLKWTNIPFSGQWGISTSFFELAKLVVGDQSSGKVGGVAQEIAEKIKDDLGSQPGFARIEATKGYLNLFFEPTLFATDILNTILDLKDHYGDGESTGQTIMVEFSQPNTHKAFHVGHLRNMVLGNSICNLLEMAGNKVIRANYLGDIGLHVIIWLWNYMKLHNGEEPPEENKTQWMGDLYAEGVRNMEASPQNEVEVRELFKRWDRRNKEIVSLWEKTRQWSLDAFNQVYSLMNIHFDEWYFESEVEKDGQELISRLIQRGIAIDERPEGSVYVNIDKILGSTEEYRTLVLLRSDGTSLYSAKDLPLAIKKFQQYNPDRSIYVIDVRQSLYMKQIFKILELMGYEWASQCIHLAYEIVNMPGNVIIASREGSVVLLEDLIREAEKRSLKIVEEKNPDQSQPIKQVIARMIALGAIKYSLLSRDNAKIITFDWETALNVNGQAAPYIQYAGVRANSILRKVDYKIPQESSNSIELTPKEISLIDLLSRFPQEVQRAAKELKPLYITNLTFEMARAFNDFYTNCPVLQSEADVRDFRIRLVAAFKQTIINALGVLGIGVPEIM